MSDLVRRIGDDLGESLPDELLPGNPEPFLRGAIAGENDAVRREAQHGLRQWVGEDEELFRCHGIRAIP